jgi:hypothetical protein
MPDFSVQNLMDRAKTKADMKVGNFVSPQEWIDFFNASNMKFQRMITARGYIHNASEVTIPASGATEYVIPEPLAILACFELMPDGYQREVEAGDVIFGGRRRGTTPGPAREYVATQTVNQNLLVEFFPVPASGTYYFVVVAQPVLFTLLTQTISVPNGWEDWIACDMAEQALTKEETINPALARQKEQIEALVEESVLNRQFAQARVRNVDDRKRGWSRVGGFTTTLVAGRWMRL